MELSEVCRSNLRAWASNNENIAELWVFSRPELDLDYVNISIALVPPTGSDNLPLRYYFAFHDKWADQVEEIVGGLIGLEVILPDTEEDAEVRATGVLLWKRPSS